MLPKVKKSFLYAWQLAIGLLVTEWWARARPRRVRLSSNRSSIERIDILPHTADGLACL